MAPRSFWTGYLKLSLVTCPVTLEPARTAQGTLRLHVLNRRTGNRVESRYVDAETGRPVDEEDQVKGYPMGEDEYVMLEDEELESVALESTRTIEIERFVPRAEVGWIWLDRPHFVKPADKVGEEAFAVIRAAMEATGTAAMSRLVLYRREHAVTLVPRDRGMVLWTLRYGDEVRPAKDYVPEGAPKKSDPKLTRLVTQLLDARTGPWDPDLTEDVVQERVEEIIAGRMPRKKRPTRSTRAPEPQDDKVVSILDALKRSVEAEKRRR